MPGSFKFHKFFLMLNRIFKRLFNCVYAKNNTFFKFPQFKETRIFSPAALAVYILFFFTASSVSAQSITTLAGTGVAGYAGDGGNALSAKFHSPIQIAVSKKGDIYVADTYNNRVRKFNVSTGIITTVAGNGGTGYSGDGGLATSAEVSRPMGVALDEQENLYITHQYCIRKVNAATGRISTLAGSSTSGFAGDGGPAAGARFADLLGIAADKNGNVFVADVFNNRIRKITAAGTVSTVAGTGTDGYNGDNRAATTANLKMPYDVTVDNSGNLYIADTYNERIRVVNTSGIIRTIAGIGSYGYSGDGAAATNAEMRLPYSLTVTAAGDVYIADKENNCIRRVNTSGIISTIAVTASGALNQPSAIAVGANGVFYVADWQNNRIRSFTDGNALSDVKLSAATINEKAPLMTTIGTLSTTDAGADTYTYTLVSGDGDNDNAAFTVAGDLLKSNTTFDYASKNTYKIRIRTTSGSGLFYEKALTISVNAPELKYSITAVEALFGKPFAIKVAANGDIYAVDRDHNKVLKYKAADRTVSTIAGTGSSGYNGDGIPAVNATLNSPVRLALAANGDVYIADNGNNRIRKVSAATGLITTVAGNGTAGYVQGGQATANPIGKPYAIALDNAGNIYFSEVYTQRILKVNASNGTIQTLAGQGYPSYNGENILASTAQLSFVYGLAVAANGDIYLGEQGNYLLRKISAADSKISTVAGVPTSFGYSGDEGPAAYAKVAWVTDVAIAANGDVYFADYNNYRIRRVAAASGIITTVAGSGAGGNNGDGGSALAAAITSFSLAIGGPDNDIYVSGDGVTQVRRLTSKAPQGITLSANTINENLAAGDVAGTFSNTSSEGNSFTYNMVAGSGDTDNAYFQIEGNQLKTVTPLNYEKKTTASIRIKVTNDTGLSLEKEFSLMVNNVNDAPSALALSKKAIAENTPVGTVVGYLSSSDEDAGDTFRYSFAQGNGDADNHRFTLDGNALKTVIPFNYAEKNSYSVRLRTIDRDGLICESSFIISIFNDAVLNGPKYIYTVAGNGTGGFGGDDGLATAARLYYPIDVLSGGSGILIADSFNKRIRKLDEASGLISTFAGGNNEISFPRSVAADAQNNLFVLTNYPDVIYKINAGTGLLSRYAGAEVSNSYQAIGDGGPAGDAIFANASDIVVAANGDLFVSEEFGNRIRKISASTGIISTIAGDGSQFYGEGGYSGDGGPAVNARLRNPYHLAIDGNNVYVADRSNYVIRKINLSTGIITTVAGNGTLGSAGDGSAAINAELNIVGAIALDKSANIYIAQPSSIRKVDAGTGIISTVAGSENWGYSGDGGLATKALLNNIAGISVNDMGEIYIADAGNNVVRKVSPFIINMAPNDITLSKLTVNDDLPAGSTAATISTTDPNEGDTFTYSLVTGQGDTDNTAFSVSGDKLITTGTLDYVAKNAYAVRLKTTDAGGISFEKSFNIAVSKINSAPSAIALSSALIDENAAAGSVIGTFSCVDRNSDDSFVYTLAAGSESDDNAYFVIENNILKSRALFNYEEKNILNIRVRCTDAGGLYFEKVFTIHVNNLPEIQNVQMFSSNENISRAKKNDLVTLRFEADKELARLPSVSIAGHNVVVIKTGNIYNASYEMTSADAEGEINFSINDIQDLAGMAAAPVNSIAAGVRYDKTAPSLQTVSIKSSNANSFYAKEGDEVTLAFESDEVLKHLPLVSIAGNAVIPVQTGNQYKATYVMRSSDTEGPVHFSVNGIKDLAGNITPELTQQYLMVTFVTFDKTAPELSDLKVKFSGSTANALHINDLIAISFEVNEALLSTPVIKLSGHDLQVTNIGNSYSAIHRVSSADLAINHFNLTIAGFRDLAGNSIADISADGPSAIDLNPASVVKENQPEGTIVGELSVNIAATGTYKVLPPQNGEDPAIFKIVKMEDEDFSLFPVFELVGGSGDTDNNAFSIQDAKLIANQRFDYETKKDYSIRVRAINSNNLPYEKVIRISIADMPEPPTNILIDQSSIAENSPIGSTVGRLQGLDPVADQTFIYSLVSGIGSEDNVYFAIEGNQVKTRESLNYEVKNTYSIRVKAVNAGSMSFEKGLTIHVTDVAEAPKDILLTSLSVEENVAVGTGVGKLSTIDEVAQQNFTYSMAAGDGDEDNHFFKIEDNLLKTAADVDYETKKIFTIRIRTVNALNLSYEKTFTIQVQDVNSTAGINVSQATDFKWTIDWGKNNSSETKKYIVKYEIKDKDGNVVVPVQTAGGFSAGSQLLVGFTIIAASGKAGAVLSLVGAALASPFAVLALPVGLVGGSIGWMIYEEQNGGYVHIGDNWDDLGVNPFFNWYVNDYLIGSANTPVPYTSGPTTPDESEQPKTFTKITTARSNSVWADIDSDGDLDLTIMAPDKTKEIKKGQTQFPRSLKLYLNINTLNMGNRGMVAYPVQALSLPEIAEGSITWFDGNNDGYSDLFVTGRDTLGNAQSKIYYQNSLRAKAAPVMEALKILADGKESIEKIDIPELPVPVFEAAKTISGLPELYRSASTTGDINNDGLPDLVVTGMKKDQSAYFGIFVQEKNGGLQSMSSSITGVVDGSVSLGDYNRSGRLSILLSGAGNAVKLYRQKVDGKFEEASLPVSATGRSKWWDYNNDGYLDIIVAGNPSKILRNEGGNSFKDVTSEVLPAGIAKLDDTAIETADLNNDGKPDFVISGTPADGEGYYTKIFYQKGTDKITFQADETTALPQVANGSINFIYDNDFTPQLFLTGNKIPSPDVEARALAKSVLVKEEPLTRAPFAFLDVTDVKKQQGDKSNTIPVSPIRLTATVNTNDSSVELSWQEAHDAETPSRGLSYNVYVSTEPGDNLITPTEIIQHADGSWGYADRVDQSFYSSTFATSSRNVVRPLAAVPSGKRQVIQVGNTIKNSFTLKGLERDRVYYWSVQTIDNAYLGSKFSSERSFYVGASGDTFLDDKSISVHPALTPNGDGINDFLYIKGISNYADNQVTIVNSKGERVWFKSGYDNNFTVFPGTTDKTFPEGTYYYIITYGGMTLTGYFVLLN